MSRTDPLDEPPRRAKNGPSQTACHHPLVGICSGNAGKHEMFVSHHVLCFAQICQLAFKLRHFMPRAHLQNFHDLNFRSRPIIIITHLRSITVIDFILLLLLFLLLLLLLLLLLILMLLFGNVKKRKRN